MFPISELNGLSKELNIQLVNTSQSGEGRDHFYWYEPDLFVFVFDVSLPEPLEGGIG